MSKRVVIEPLLWLAGFLIALAWLGPSFGEQATLRAQVTQLEHAVAEGQQLIATLEAAEAVSREREECEAIASWLCDDESARRELSLEMLRVFEASCLHLVSETGWQVVAGAAGRAVVTRRKECVLEGDFRALVGACAALETRSPRLLVHEILVERRSPAAGVRARLFLDSFERVGPAALEKANP